MKAHQFSPMQYYINTGCPAIELSLIYDLSIQTCRKLIKTANRVIRYQQLMESKIK